MFLTVLILQCMFFGPTLVALGRRKNCRIFVLCLSNGKMLVGCCLHGWWWKTHFTGDFDKQGHLRKDELWNSCRTLNIDARDVFLMKCTLLPDDPQVEWKVEVLSQLILNYIEALDIDLLLTFDKEGISQHKNHQAIYYATASLCLSGLMPSSCKILVLDSVNVIRKYISFFDVFSSLLLSTSWSVLKWKERKTVQTAMQEHKSQMMWFRKLYIVFSRYMLINSLSELSLESIEFDILES